MLIVQILPFEAYLSHPWALSEHYILTILYNYYTFQRFHLCVCVHQINTHPDGTERSESPAFDSHVVKRNKGIGDYFNSKKGGNKK